MSTNIDKDRNVAKSVEETMQDGSTGASLSNPIEYDAEGYAICKDGCIAGNIGFCKCDPDCECHCHIEGYAYHSPELQAKLKAYPNGWQTMGDGTVKKL